MRTVYDGYWLGDNGGFSSLRTPTKRYTGCPFVGIGSRIHGSPCVLVHRRASTMRCRSRLTRWATRPRKFTRPGPSACTSLMRKAWLRTKASPAVRLSPRRSRGVAGPAPALSSAASIEHLLHDVGLLLSGIPCDNRHIGSFASEMLVCALLMGGGWVTDEGHSPLLIEFLRFCRKRLSVVK